MLSLTIDEMPFAPFGASYPRKLLNLTGQRFYKLLVVSAFAMRNNQAFWLCKCDCGQWVVRQTTKLRTATYDQSCGCVALSRRIASVATHGATRGQVRIPEYYVYTSAKQRCVTPTNRQFSNYGGRGIEFRFESFEEFFAEVGSRPSRSHSLDRIDNNGHYEKGNLRWATHVEQNENRRDSRHLEWQGESLSIGKWADRLQVSRATLWSRLRHGWSTEQILTTPTEGRHRKRVG